MSNNAKRVLFRKGTTADHQLFTGARGEVTVDITRNIAIVHNGITTGGHELVGVAATGQSILNKDSIGIGTDNPDSSVSIANTGIIHAGIVTANYYYGDGSTLSNIDATTITLGTPIDGTFSDGAITLTSSSNIVNSIDDLNELALNMMKNYAVSDVDFTSNILAGGSPLSIQLNITSAGNPNNYYIDWGDGTSPQSTSDSTPNHTYSIPNGGLFSIDVLASNTNGVGSGSSFTKFREDYIVVYTPNPVVSFNLYRNSSGGVALSGNDYYVIEGDVLYLENTTTNTSVATVDYTMEWDDGSTDDSIATNDASGGVNGTRLQHTWTQSNTGTGRDTLRLTLNNHNTADPGVIPVNTTNLLKVYEDNPTEPDGLGTKTLSNVSSTGTSPKLAHGFTDNTGGSSLTSSSSVVRVTSGTVTAGPIPTFAYNAEVQTLSAQVNGSIDGQRLLSTGDDTGTYGSLVINSESDYQLLNSSGSPVSFSNSTYYPGFAKGFKASISKAVSQLFTGVNSMQLSHASNLFQNHGDTNTIEFVKDDITSVPSVSISGATLTQNVAGTFKYISGVPYYNSGSPSLTLSGVTISNLVGQCYTNQSDIVEVDDGTNQESTSNNAISNSNYTYAQIDGASSMLTGGIPKVNTGTTSAYTIGNLTVPINSSSVRTVSRVKVRAKNVNGTSSYSSNITTNIQVHTAAQSGISEVAIAVANSLGNGTFTDDGVRIFDLSAETTNTPSYNGSTNFYTSNPYTESSDPGVAGTKEATVRIGNIKYDVTNYSLGYLPAGPNRSLDFGTQYFTFAFRRQAVANFDINISSSGISGLWIAAPGTSIDSTSTLNGWLEASSTYAGSGVPGADTGAGGNGSNGCAFNSSDTIASGTFLSGGYTMTLGGENMSNSTGNVVLVRIALATGQSITSLSIGEAVT